MKFLLLLILVISTNGYARIVDMGKDLDVELLKEFNDFIKAPPKKDKSLLENYVVANPFKSKSRGKAGKTIPRKYTAKKISQMRKPLIKTSVDSAIQKELELLNKKIEEVEQESKNLTIVQKKKTLNRPVEYETYKTIIKIPLNEIRVQDDILKHDDEIIEIKFTNLMDKEF